MSKCDFIYCEGHLGKFSSCRDEAIYALALDERWDGDVDFGVCWTVVDYAQDLYYGLNSGEVDVSLADGGTTWWVDETPVKIPAGVYLVETNDQGFVYVNRWPEQWDADLLIGWESKYAEWLDSEDSF